MRARHCIFPHKISPLHVFSIYQTILFLFQRLKQEYEDATETRERVGSRAYCERNHRWRRLVVDLPSAMKQAQSGLRTIKRDFSAGSMSSQPIDVDGSEWPPTPAASVEPKPLGRPLTGSEQRLKNIQDALAGLPSTSSSQPLTAKRPNPSNNAGYSMSEPPAKKRVLPSAWEEPPPPKSLASKRPTDVIEKQKPSGSRIAIKAGTSKPAVATVFLSNEQQKILKLVSDGQCLFYTGSAGEYNVRSHTLLRHFCCLRLFHVFFETVSDDDNTRYRKVCPPARDHQDT